jgi:hypothetical protein
VTTTTPPGKTPEKVDVPAKKLPADPSKSKGTDEVRYEPAPTPSAIRVTPAIPSVDITPVQPPAPRVGGDRRDPF